MLARPQQDVADNKTRSATIVRIRTLYQLAPVGGLVVLLIGDEAKQDGFQQRQVRTIPIVVPGERPGKSSGIM